MADLSYLSLYVLRWTPSLVETRFSSSGTGTLKSKESFTCSGRISPLSNRALSFIAFVAVDQSHWFRAFSLSKVFGLSTSSLMPTCSPANVRAKRTRLGVLEDVALDIPSSDPSLFLSASQNKSHRNTQGTPTREQSNRKIIVKCLLSKAALFLCITFVDTWLDSSFFGLRPRPECSKQKHGVLLDYIQTLFWI